jgi:hypothetical protein
MEMRERERHGCDCAGTRWQAVPLCSALSEDICKCGSLQRLEEREAIPACRAIWRRDKSRPPSHPDAHWVSGSSFQSVSTTPLIRAHTLPSSLQPHLRAINPNLQLPRPVQPGSDGPGLSSGQPVSESRRRRGQLSVQGTTSFTVLRWPATARLVSASDFLEVDALLITHCSKDSH